MPLPVMPLMGPRPLQRPCPLVGHGFSRGTASATTLHLSVYSSARFNGLPALPASAIRTPEGPMPKYIIEREVPGAGQLTDAQLKALSLKSVSVLHELGTRIQWLESFVTDDKIY